MTGCGVSLAPVLDMEPKPYPRGWRARPLQSCAARGGGLHTIAEPPGNGAGPGVGRSRAVHAGPALAVAGESGVVMQCAIWQLFK